MSKARTRLTRKIIRKFLYLYSVIFLILSILILTVSWNLMLRNSRETLSSRVSIIMDSWDSYYRTIQDKQYELLSSGRLKELLQQYNLLPTEEHAQQINLALSTLQTADSRLRYIILEKKDDAVFHSLNYAGEQYLTQISDREEYANLWNTNSSFLSPVITEDASGTRTPYCFYLTEQTILGSRYLLTLCYDAQIFSQNFAQTVQELSNAYLLTYDGAVIYNAANSSESAPEAFFDQTVRGMTGTFFTNLGYTYYQYSSHSPMLAVGYISYLRFFGAFALLFLLLLAVYLIPMSIAFFYLTRVNDQYLSPLQELSDSVNQYQLAGEPIKTLETEDELQDLSQVLNQMSLNLNRQSAELARHEREQALSEYRLLTTQMNPHFIYNTMNIINVLARRGAYEDIINVNTALTRVIREQLNTKRLLWETVDSEVEFLKQYQVIMDYRYRNQVNVEFEIDPEVGHCYIPKNILQPLMENAYYHGLSSEFEEMKGEISLYIYPSENDLVLELCDDGNGFSEKRLQEVRNHFSHPENPSEMQNHLGMANIYQRLSHLYGSHFSMEIQSELKKGTMIILTVPLLQQAPTDDFHL